LRWLVGTGITSPCSLSPLTSLALAVIAERAGLPSGVVNVLAGYGHTTGLHGVICSTTPTGSRRV
jgi:acyl-CoA reductase-like NAD-dependent aldehyde dehydrogenase